MQHTFFAQFVAGEDAATIAPAIARLQRARVGAILDFAAEADVATAVKGVASSHARPTTTMAHNKDAEFDANLAQSLAGVKDAAGTGGFAAVKLTALAPPELLLAVSSMLHDHRRAFRRFTPPPPLSALSHENVYTRGRVSRDTFCRVLAGARVSEVAANSLFDALDYMGDGSLDYLEWLDGLALLRLGGSTSEGRSHLDGSGGGSTFDPLVVLAALVPGTAVQLSRDDVARLQAVLLRVDTLADAAAAAGVSLLVDAEQTYVQPAIDWLTVAAARRHNRPRDASVAWWPPEVAHALSREAAAALHSRGGSVDKSTARGPPLVRAADALLPAAIAAAAEARARGLPALPPHLAWPFNSSTLMFVDAAPQPPHVAVWNTYQCYLRDAPSRLALGLARARREGWVLGAKLVRGAYMEQERALAAERGYSDPVQPTLEATAATYLAAADLLLPRVAVGGARVMFATHNEDSVSMLTARMAALGVQPGKRGGASFAQLFGMCDELTFGLASKGHATYKYVPYGPVASVLPYLMRRAAENGDVLAGGARRELRAIEGELAHRTRAALGLRT